MLAARTVAIVYTVAVGSDMKMMSDPGKRMPTWEIKVGIGSVEAPV